MEESRKAEGLKIALNKLTELGEIYGSKYTLPKIQTPLDYRGKETKVLIWCEKHQSGEYRTIESFRLQVGCPCSKCAKLPENYGKAPERVKAHRDKQTALGNKGSDNRVFKTRSEIFWKSKECLLTGITFIGNDPRHQVHAHHLNSKRDFPEGIKIAEFNSVNICEQIHSFYHVDFLGRKINYDVRLANLNFGSNVNVLTFLLFLDLLEEDFNRPYSDNLALAQINQAILKSWPEYLDAGTVNDQEPKLISKDRVKDLRFKLSTDTRFFKRFLDWDTTEYLKGKSFTLEDIVKKSY